jgi:hypothetical protein
MADVRRIRIRSKIEFQNILADLEKEPLIISNFLEIFPDSKSLVESIGLIEGLERLGCEDMVGVVDAADRSVSGIPFTEAIKQLKTKGGYINGWEYFHSSTGLGLPDLDSAVSQDSFLLKLWKGGRMLDSVMRWIFISNNFENAGSDWHVDPIGSAAFMLMIAGEKKWFFADGKFETILRETEFLLVPSGMNHRIENIGSGLNVAVSHNWVPNRSCDRMWTEVRIALALVSNHSGDLFARIEDLNSQGFIDNLLMGLLMVLLQSWEDVEAFVPSDVKPVIQNLLVNR